MKLLKEAWRKEGRKKNQATFTLRNMMSNISPSVSASYSFFLLAAFHSRNWNYFIVLSQDEYSGKKLTCLVLVRVLPRFCQPLSTMNSPAHYMLCERTNKLWQWSNYSRRDYNCNFFFLPFCRVSRLDFHCSSSLHKMTFAPTLKAA